jgi:hypothetical protein
MVRQVYYLPEAIFALPKTGLLPDNFTFSAGWNSGS